MMKCLKKLFKKPTNVDIELYDINSALFTPRTNINYIIDAIQYLNSLEYDNDRLNNKLNLIISRCEHVKSQFDEIDSLVCEVDKLIKDREWR